MNTRLLKLFNIAAICLVSISTHAENISDKQLIEAFRQNPYRAAAGHTPYEAPADGILQKQAR